VGIPVIAAGGIADGRGLAAALALGADGVQMGTRFICTSECIAHPSYKQRIVQAGDRATTTTGRSIGHPMRAIRNPMVHQFGDLERTDASEQQIIEFGSGKLRLAAIDGDVVNGSVMCGQSCGLVRDVVPVTELIERIVGEAEGILTKMSALAGA
jgi:enoyl-[acyl-carrier protein] reductase II